MEKKAASFLLSLVLVTLSTQRAAAAAFSPAVYVIGDSLVDVGNNNFLPNAPKANFLPYGIDFPGRIPTGRYTNGFTVADFIAKAAGLRMSPPAFLSLANGVQMLRGVNFASGGAGILDSTVKFLLLSSTCMDITFNTYVTYSYFFNGLNMIYQQEHQVIPMSEQIKDLAIVISNLTAKIGIKLASESLKKSLFYFSMGSNDLGTLYNLMTPGNSTQKEEVVALMIQTFKDQLQTIYHLGARKFAVLGTTSFGCVPEYRLMNPSGDCYEDVNDLSLRFQIATKALLEELSVSLKGFKYSFTDFYEIFNEILAYPHKYGFTELKAACCGSGRLNAEEHCMPNSTYCSDRNQYFFWDQTHPSEAAHKVLAELSLYGPPLFANPINIHHDVPKANFSPYGIDYPGGIPTGRFTNGFNSIDFIAKAIGLVMSPPSYLSLANEEHQMEMKRGVNFASGGSGILDTTGEDVISMTKQIKDFESVAANLTAREGDKFASALLKRSLFFCSVGSNDLFAFATLLTPGNSSQKDEIVALVVNKYKDQLQTLYHLGARKFAISGTGSIGCIPGVRVLIPSGDCYAELNDLSARFNTALKALLEELRTSLKGFEYSFADVNEMGVQVEANPHKYGFTELKAACCGSGWLNSEQICSANMTYCSNRSEYYFWDQVHPSQAAYKLAAQLSVNGTLQFAEPINIHQLLKWFAEPVNNYQSMK
ncbi:GDSL esterase/lipase [Canna indica]|uniref:GDSL esterase/lipase n=1 Tax=Canna indica TaxID=4628 RepID=A0AAQ3K198_9LILI|nr:GDSL esterase/lipase [Canna indica]